MSSSVLFTEPPSYLGWPGVYQTEPPERDAPGNRASHHALDATASKRIASPALLLGNYRKRPANTGVNTDGSAGSSARNSSHDASKFGRPKSNFVAQLPPASNRR